MIELTEDQIIGIIEALKHGNAMQVLLTIKFLESLLP